MENDETMQRLFVETMDEHCRIISKICCMYAADADHYEDLYQESLVNLWRGFASYRGRAKLSSWIYRVVLNTCISSYRRDRRHRSGRLPLSVCAAKPAAEEAGVEERIGEMYALIARLDSFERGLVMLWLDELSYEEIAEITGLTRGGVASKLHRIREKLTRLADKQK